MAALSAPLAPSLPFRTLPGAPSSPASSPRPQSALSLASTNPHPPFSLSYTPSSSISSHSHFAETLAASPSAASACAASATRGCVGRRQHSSLPSTWPCRVRTAHRSAVPLWGRQDLIPLPPLPQASHPSALTPSIAEASHRPRACCWPVPVNPASSTGIRRAAGFRSRLNSSTRSSHNRGLPCSQVGVNWVAPSERRPLGAWGHICSSPPSQPQPVCSGLFPTQQRLPSSSYRPQHPHSDFCPVDRRVASSSQALNQVQLLLGQATCTPGRLGRFGRFGDPGSSPARASPSPAAATSEVLDEPKTSSEAEPTAKEPAKKKAPRPPKPKVELKSTTMSHQDSVIPGTEHEVILQAFNWESHRSWDPSWWGRLAQMVPEIADLGFTSVWLPPPSSSLAPQGYLPQDLYKLDSSYGNESELRNLLRALKDRNVKAVLDVVVNHRCGSGQDEEGRWTRYPGLRPEWNEDAVTSDTGGKGSASTGAVFEGIPNIDHTQEFVRSDLKSWLAWLRDDVGFTSFRFDFAKGYSPEFAREYLESVRPDLAVGEFWTDCNYSGEDGEEHELDYDQDSHRQSIVDWIDGTGGQSAAFDFTTKAILQEAAKTGEWGRLKDGRGKAPGLLGFWPSRAVTFIDNHDTGSTQAHWPFPREKITQGYAYILTHPGMPTVFYDHLFEWGEETMNAISTLLGCRKQAGVTCDSLLSILKADNECYVAAVGEKLVVEIGSSTWVEKNDPEKLYELIAKGTEGSDYAVWIEISETKEC